MGEFILKDWKSDVGELTNAHYEAWEREELVTDKHGNVDKRSFWKKAVDHVRNNWYIYTLGLGFVWYGLSRAFPELWPWDQDAFPANAESGTGILGGKYFGLVSGITAGVAGGALASLLNPKTVVIDGDGTTTVEVGNRSISVPKKSGTSSTVVLMGVLAMILMLVVSIVACAMMKGSDSEDQNVVPVPRGIRNLVKKPVPGLRAMRRNGMRPRRDSLEAANRMNRI